MSVLSGNMEVHHWGREINMPGYESNTPLAMRSHRRASDGLVISFDLDDTLWPVVEVVHQDGLCSVAIDAGGVQGVCGHGGSGAVLLHLILHLSPI